MDLRGGLKGFAGSESAQTHALTLGIAAGALTEAQAASMAALFPAIRFGFLGENPRDLPADLDILFMPVDGSAPEQIEAAVRQCKLNPAAPKTVFVLHHADLSNTRALLQSGAVDVLPAPVAETALALCLERIAARGRPGRGAPRPVGQLVAVLKAGGRLAVVSFHSLEDRIVKTFLTARCGRTPGGSRHAPPAHGGPPPSFALLFNGAHGPSEAEIAANPRSRSAKLRAAVRTAAPAWGLAA